MCGILAVVGEYRYKDIPDALLERGPDDFGVYQDEHAQLIQSRLKITGGDIELPHQSSKHVLLFNGQIYNWVELANDMYKNGIIQKLPLTDFEVILSLYEHYGHDFVEMLDGQFAILIYNKRSKHLHVFCDEMRIRTVYEIELEGKGLFYSSNLASLPHVEASNIMPQRGYGNVSRAEIL